jgi:hypothetical protein
MKCEVNIKSEESPKDMLKAKKSSRLKRKRGLEKRGRPRKYEHVNEGSRTK